MNGGKEIAGETRRHGDKTSARRHRPRKKRKRKKEEEKNCIPANMLNYEEGNRVCSDTDARILVFLFSDPLDSRDSNEK